MCVYVAKFCVTKLCDVRVCVCVKDLCVCVCACVNHLNRCKTSFFVFCLVFQQPNQNFSQWVTARYHKP